jgi:hypothetical protein
MLAGWSKSGKWSGDGLLIRCCYSSCFILKAGFFPELEKACFFMPTDRRKHGGRREGRQLWYNYGIVYRFWRKEADR